MRAWLHSPIALAILLISVCVWVLLSRERISNLSGYTDTLYSDLDLPVNATGRQIRAAFKRLCLVWHPDKRPRDEDPKISNERYKAIKHAYEILVDPEVRHVYDVKELPGLLKTGKKKAASQNPVEEYEQEAEKKVKKRKKSTRKGELVSEKNNARFRKRLSRIYLAQMTYLSERES
mmetsp:Transcript_13384/g.20036  ORF Transcript_13384/g.20036 Transcript_13384/m.20036 type:complete len:177 (+) Transcript_13384:2732-3262(+)